MPKFRDKASQSSLNTPAMTRMTCKIIKIWGNVYLRHGENIVPRLSEYGDKLFIPSYVPVQITLCLKEYK